jgi:hypothetical protein
MLVEVVGILQYGTEAAADMITSPELLTEALHDAPKGWQNKNLQLVLHVKVISGTPAARSTVQWFGWCSGPVCEWWPQARSWGCCWRRA